MVILKFRSCWWCWWGTGHDMLREVILIDEKLMLVFRRATNISFLHMQPQEFFLSREGRRLLWLYWCWNFTRRRVRFNWDHPEGYVLFSRDWINEKNTSLYLMITCYWMGYVWSPHVHSFYLILGFFTNKLHIFPFYAHWIGVTFQII